MNTRMKIAAPALAAMLALGISAPASAAQFDTPASLRSDIAQLDKQIDRALARHQITYREAARLNARVDQLQYSFRQYARGGFTNWELNRLEQRIDSVKWQLAQDKRDDRNGNRKQYDNDHDRAGKSRDNGDRDRSSR